MTNEQHAPPVSRAPRIVGILTVVLLVMAIGVRLAGQAGRLGQTAGNLSALRTAMKAAAGETVATAEQAVPDAPLSGVQARAMAFALAQQGQPSAAEAWLLAGMSDPQATYLTQFQLCRLYWELGMPTRATQACQGTVVSADYWLEEGYRSLDAGRTADALALFEIAAYTAPDRAEAWRRYGHSLLAAGRDAEAVAALERVLFLVPTPEADVYQALAEAYLKVDNITMARDVLDEGLVRYPDQRQYYRGMADSYLVEGDLKTADSWYVRMLQRWPYDAQVWAARAEIAADEGRVADALEYYQQAATNSPDGFGYWMNVAAIAAEAGNASVVTSATSRALELRPDDAGAWLQAGRYLTQTNQPDAARAAFERVLVLQPGNLEAAAELAAINGATVP